MLTAAELREDLNIDAATLRRWLKDGLPTKGKGAKQRFDAEAVAKWLLETGNAKPLPAAPAEKVCTTRADAANEIGVNLRTLAEWLNDPTFPGKAGSPGRADSYFPIDQIRAWRAAKFGTAGGGNDELTQLRAARLRTQVEREQLELARELGSIVDFDDVRNLLENGVATAKSILDQLPEQILANLPGKLDKAIKAKIRELIQTKLEQAYDILEGLSREDEEDQPPPAEASPAAPQPPPNPDKPRKPAKRKK